MPYLPLLGVLLLAAISQSAPNSRIFGGQNTSIQRYPSLVQIEYYDPTSGIWNQQCMGNILSTNWVLTAAQCFNRQDRVEYMRIRAGSNYHGTAAPADADIAVIKLLNPLVFSPSIQKANIASRRIVVPDNYPVVHAGWGTNSTAGPSSYILQNVTVYTVSRRECARRYAHIKPISITRNMICAGVLDVGGRDVCNWNTGGPMYIGDIIVGIVSFGNNCNDSYYPRISTSVPAYSDWIVANAR
ncbi:trypsin, alkaline C-like [Colias croceus]|uniref:trypsin, alkaline C-like n=1 Tax=Colias crocea TaxID=72248 RepID=UPI001E2813BA|nr:trypsin, alkaline C-like [Colias croceus]